MFLLSKIYVMKCAIRYFIIAFTGVGLVLTLSACSESGKSDTQERKEDEQVVDVKVQEIRLQEFTEVIRVTGSIEAFEDVMVPAEEGGRILEWKIPKGANVSKGQIIARVDDALTKAAFDAADANYQLADITYQKQKKVYEEKAISEWQIKSYEYQRDAAKAQADLAKARLEKTLIKSPIDGVLNNRFVDAGEMVAPGAPVAHIVNTRKLKVAAGIPERYAGSFRIGNTTQFTVDAFPSDTFHGTIGFIAAAVNKDNRTIPVEINIEGNPGKLKSDMIAALKIILAAQSESVVIKEDYLQQVDKDRYVVFVANDGIAEERRITIGAENGGNVLVKEGLKEGDKIITLGFQNVTNGQKIAIHK